VKGLPQPIPGGGEKFRDFTHVGGIVDGLLMAGAMEQAIGQEFNLASGVKTKILDPAEMVNEVTGNSAGIRFVPRRKWDTKSRLLASIERARELISYESTSPFEDGLLQTVERFRANWDHIERSAAFGPGVSAAVRQVVVKPSE